MSQQADSSQLANCDHIPVIDLSSIDSVSLEERQKLARTIFDACTQVGFFYIKV
jgi:isopenicillin N synthase-like dioxygenase